MRNQILIFTLLILAACKSPLKEEGSDLKISSQEKQHIYPPSVVSLKLENLYDTAMWWTYCYNCDQKAIFYDGKFKADTFTFGELNINSTSVELHGNDTIDLLFDFYKDSVKAHYLEKEAYKICVGLQFKISTKEIIAIIGTSSLPYKIIAGFPPIETSRNYVPLQPDVIKYIRQNEKALNPWFRNEAIKRGVLKE